jgi:hypothetical protein
MTSGYPIQYSEQSTMAGLLFVSGVAVQTLPTRSASSPLNDGGSLTTTLEGVAIQTTDAAIQMRSFQNVPWSSGKIHGDRLGLVVLFLQPKPNQRLKSQATTHVRQDSIRSRTDNALNSIMKK